MAAIDHDEHIGYISEAVMNKFQKESLKSYGQGTVLLVTFEEIIDFVAAEADQRLHRLKIAQRLADFVVAFDVDAVVELVLQQIEHRVVG